MKSQFKRLSQNEIAESTGLSRSTIGHILNGRARELHIAVETEKRVLALAEEKGYLKNRAVRQLQASKTFQIAFITNFDSRDNNNPTMPPAVIHMIDILQKENYTTLLINVDVRSEDISQAFQEHCFDGMVIYGIVPNQDFFVEWGRKHKIPHVFLHHDRVAKNNVGIDEEQTAYYIVGELKKLGFCRIAFYFPREVELNKYFPEDYLFSREIFIRQAIKSLKLKQYPSSVEQREESNNPAGFLMKQKETPDCLIAYDTYTAISLLGNLHELGYSVPKDIGILAYSYDKYNSITMPCLCGVDFDNMEIGRNLAEMILQQIESGEECENRLTIGKLVLEKGGIRFDSLDFFGNKKGS
ncbi:MAG: hypothetical protein A2017_09180 [Lentisphaerae bacterium GWF2_44_16]|nr:MAG: hypothetical protein A2017_09180 [Lentisphaerae bacterium GWF2_44_16]